MTVAWRHLVGTRENLDITIEAHIRNNWTDVNLSPTHTPVFENLSHLPTNSIEDDGSTAANLVRFSIDSRLRTDDEEDEPLGDSAHTWKIRVQVDVWAEDYELLTQIEDELNRIFWEIVPNEGVRLNKSDGTKPPTVGANASEAVKFIPSEIDFEFQGSDDTAFEHRVGSQGFLEIWAFKDKS